MLDALKKLEDAREALKKATGADHDAAVAKVDDAIDAYAKAEAKMEKAGIVWNQTSDTLQKALSNVHAASLLFKAWLAEYEKHCGPYDSQGNWDKLHGKTVPPDDEWHDNW